MTTDFSQTFLLLPLSVLDLIALATVALAWLACLVAVAFHYISRDAD